MSLKVLVCDADWRFVDRAQSFLQAHGHQVLAEPLPAEALEVAMRWRPDVLVLSSEAADGAGAELLAGVKLLRPRPALLLTGQLEHFEAAWRAWQQGADELLLKPVFDAFELHTAILKAIQHATPERATFPAA